MKPNFWSEAEDALIKFALDRGMDWKPLAAMLPGRTPDAIKTRLRDVRDWSGRKAAPKPVAAPVVGNPYTFDASHDAWRQHCLHASVLYRIAWDREVERNLAKKRAAIAQLSVDNGDKLLKMGAQNAQISTGNAMGLA